MSVPVSVFVHILSNNDMVRVNHLPLDLLVGSKVSLYFPAYSNSLHLEGKASKLGWDLASAFSSLRHTYEVVGSVLDVVPTSERPSLVLDIETSNQIGIIKVSDVRSYGLVISGRLFEQVQILSTTRGWSGGPLSYSDLSDIPHPVV